MAAVSATGMAISLPSQLNNHTSIPQKSSHLLKSPVRRKTPAPVCRAHWYSTISDSLSNHHHLSYSSAAFPKIIRATAARNLVLIDLDPTTAKLGIALLGPFLSTFGFLFIARIVMSWYPKLPVEEFPYVVAYAPTEPLLVQTRKIIPPLAGVDVTPVVWFGLLSFLNEILVGPQGLLVLLSQQKV